MGLSKNIAYRLQTLRAASGLSQEELADRADLSLSLVAKMEQGRKADPRASTLLALSAALGVRPGQLIEDLTAPPEGTFPPKGKKKKRAVLVGAGIGSSSGLGFSALTEALEADDRPERKKKNKKAK